MKNELIFAAVTEEDINFILDNLWHRGEEEAVMYGLKNRPELCRHLLGMTKAHGYCICKEEVPIAAFGANWREGNRYTTWFIATERFTEAALSITRFLRGFVAEQLHDHPEATLEIISATGHPDGARWFNTLGFVQKGSPNGVFVTYEYVK